MSARQPPVRRQGSRPSRRRSPAIFRRFLGLRTPPPDWAYSTRPEPAPKAPLSSCIQTPFTVTLRGFCDRRRMRQRRAPPSGAGLRAEPPRIFLIRTQRRQNRCRPTARQNPRQVGQSHFRLPIHQFAKLHCCTQRAVESRAARGGNKNGRSVRSRRLHRLRAVCVSYGCGQSSRGAPSRRQPSTREPWRLARSIRHRRQRDTDVEHPAAGLFQAQNDHAPHLQRICAVIVANDDSRFQPVCADLVAETKANGGHARQVEILGVAPA